MGAIVRNLPNLRCFTSENGMILISIPYFLHDFRLDIFFIYNLWNWLMGAGLICIAKEMPGKHMKADITSRVSVMLYTAYRQAELLPYYTQCKRIYYFAEITINKNLCRISMINRKKTVKRYTFWQSFVYREIICYLQL